MFLSSYKKVERTCSWFLFSIKWVLLFLLMTIQVDFHRYTMISMMEIKLIPKHIPKVPPTLETVCVKVVDRTSSYFV